MCVLWKQKTPIAAKACFIDRNKKIICSYLVGYNPEYEKLSPGNMLQAYSICHAIKRNFKIFDLGKGDYDYKYFFGAKNRNNTNIIISRKNLRLSFAKIQEKIENKILGNSK